jgi:hypothetical protein
MAPRWPMIAALALLPAACDQGAAPDDVVGHPRAEEIANLTPASEALANASVAKLDPAPLNGAEIRRALGDGPLCLFHYARSGPPVLAASGDGRRGVVKLNGHLVMLEAGGGAEDGAARSLRLAGGPVRVQVMPPPSADVVGAGSQEFGPADMVLEVGEELRVGYGGHAACRPAPPAVTSRR